VTLAAPVALAPAETIYTTRPTFSWTAVSGATQYFVTIVDLTTPEVIQGAVATNSLTLGFSLKPGDTYQWSVQALDNQGDASGFSNSLEFAVAFGSK
jgi:Fibronectin type III domain